MTTAARVSTTRRRLLRLRAAMLVCTAAVLAATVATFLGVQFAVADATTRRAPAVVEAAAARAALVEADNAAVASFRTGQAALTGPGDRYRSQVVAARQSLTQVAEHNAAGDEGSRSLRLIEGLLGGYTDFVDQANAHFRQPGGELRAAADLWYAARMMHAERDGILAQMDILVATQQAQLRVRLAEGWMAATVAVLWLAPVLALLVLLVWTQVYLRRRFHRLLNVPLLAATGLLVAVAALTSLAFDARADARTAGSGLDAAVAGWRADTDEDVAVGRAALFDLIEEHCARPGRGCGDTFAAVAAAAPRAATGDDESSPPTRRLQEVDELLVAADEPAVVEYAIAALAAAIGVLIVLGLRDRIDEYTYRRS